MIEQHEISIRVRYAETDAMGFLHHSHYFTYFEMGRTELFRAQGGDYRKLEEDGHFLVVAELRCKFRAPARYDDLLTLRTTLARLSPVKMEHEYELFRDGKLLTTAHSVLACVDREGRLQRIPDVIPALAE
ncbi:MAG TPA: thioesterase family protein [Planctomycetaceae bacterium]|nr:thioesterase family protein [Planctomycetaceae bacterium]